MLCPLAPQRADRLFVGVCWHWRNVLGFALSAKQRRTIKKKKNVGIFMRSFRLHLELRCSCYARLCPLSKRFILIISASQVRMAHFVKKGISDSKDSLFVTFLRTMSTMKGAAGKLRRAFT